MWGGRTQVEEAKEGKRMGRSCRCWWESDSGCAEKKLRNLRFLEKSMRFTLFEKKIAPLTFFGYMIYAKKKTRFTL